MHPLVSKVFDDNWPIRRRWLAATLIWLGVNIDVMLWWKGLDALSLQLAMAMLTAMVALIGSYVFGAVWDDRSKRRHMQSLIGTAESTDAASGLPCASETPPTDDTAADDDAASTGTP